MTALLDLNTGTLTRNGTDFCSRTMRVSRLRSLRRRVIVTAIGGLVNSSNNDDGGQFKVALFVDRARSPTTT